MGSGGVAGIRWGAQGAGALGAQLLRGHLRALGALALASAPPGLLSGLSITALSPAIRVTFSSFFDLQSSSSSARVRALSLSALALPSSSSFLPRRAWALSLPSGALQHLCKGPCSLSPLQKALASFSKSMARALAWLLVPRAERNSGRAKEAYFLKTGAGEKRCSK